MRPLPTRRRPARRPATGRTAARRGALSALAALTALLAATPSLAAAPFVALTDGDVVVTNTETVQARLDASGMVREARVYEQLTFTGDGSARVENPVSERGLRNLDGFGAPAVSGGSLRTSVDVEGTERMRTVSDFVGELPLGVDVTYRLDGETVTPREVLGRSGVLEVRYTVTNLTARDDAVEFADGTGGTGSETAETVVPMVGQLVTTLPPGFTAVTSEEANISGDGRGGTRLTYQMTLFPPIGATSLELGYTARITRGVVPPATITALPVSPLTSASFKGGSASYASGAQSGADLAAGALELDTNLLRLHDGAQELLGGLVQLRDGAAELSTGLAEAAPGAATLAAGLGTADAGAGDLAAGVRRVDAGTKEVAAGAARVGAGAQGVADGAARTATGAGDVAAGARRTDAGARDLATGARAVDDGSLSVAEGSARLDAGLSTAAGQVPRLLGGLTEVETGLTRIDRGLAELSGAVGMLPTRTQALTDGVAQLRAAIGDTSTSGSLVGGTEAVRQALGLAVTGLGDLQAGNDLARGRIGSGADLRETAETLRDAASVLPPEQSGVADTLVASAATLDTRALELDVAAGASARVGGGLRDLATQLQAGVLPGVARIECGLSSASLPGVCDAARPGVLQGLGAVDAGLGTLTTTVVGEVQGAIGSATDGEDAKTLRGGVHAVQGGIGRLSSGGTTLAGGLGELSTGAAALRGGAAAVASGADRVATGASDLATGTGQLAAGATRVADGTGQVASGASALADGAAQVAAGGAQLGAGTGELSTGAAALAAGTGRLASGAEELAAGIGRAADGSTLVADGLVTAADGAPELVDGARRLSSEGTSLLVERGRATASDYGVKYAVIEAGAERAAAEGMAFGAPEGAAGATAYSLEIAGVDGAGARSLGRGVAAVALFAVGAVVAGLLGRRTA